MSIQDSGSLAVYIVSEAEVRRYAQDKLSPKQEKEIQQLLLDDDRARDLVRDAAAPPTRDTAPLEVWTVLLGAVETCGKSVGAYEQLSETDIYLLNVPHTLKHCCAERRALFDEMTTLLGPDQGRAPSCARTATVKLADSIDAELNDRLMNAFGKPAAPGWKVKIADWITTIQQSRCI